MATIAASARHGTADRCRKRVNDLVSDPRQFRQLGRRFPGARHTLP